MSVCCSNSRLIQTDVAAFEESLQRELGYHFKRLELLRQALTHRSFSADHNERLEFLGDGILNMVVAMLLFERFPVLREGELSRLRASLVKQDALAQIAQELRLGDSLRLGEGELKSGGQNRPSILADAVEASLGAIFLDSGFDAVHAVIAKLYQQRLEKLDPARSLKDPKTGLQELLQARHLPLPQYDLFEIRGEAHAQEFEIDCSVPSLRIKERGRGSSRRIAEQAAAAAVLERMAQT